jgi:predicted trehalose synthase
MNSILSGERPVVGGRVLTVDGDGRVLVDGGRVEAGGGVARALANAVVDGGEADAPERGIAVDQTNTSVIVGDRFVVKIVGEWAAAERAGRLLGRLADAGVDGVARLHGIVEWEHPERGTATLAIVTEYLPGAEDGWTWAVDDVLAHLDGAPAPAWPATLGAQVARMHDVLATDTHPAPADAPATRRTTAESALATLDTPAGRVASASEAPTVGRVASASERIETSQAALETGSPGLDTRPTSSSATRPAGGPTGGEARLVNRRAALARDIRSLEDAAAGLVFPIHGDLHVGQILASPADPGRYTIIDFDGDPQLVPAERDRPDAAARDVAHLLVSFDLVAAVVQKRLQRADPAAWSWADRARAEFLAAYRAELTRTELLDDALLPGFEAQQLVAELHYADRFLPRWSYAPDAAITHRYPSTHEHPESPWTPPQLEPLETP